LLLLLKVNECVELRTFETLVEGFGNGIENLDGHVNRMKLVAIEPISGVFFDLFLYAPKVMVQLRHLMIVLGHPVLLRLINPLSQLLDFLSGFISLPLEIDLTVFTLGDELAKPFIHFLYICHHLLILYLPLDIMFFDFIDVLLVSYVVALANLRDLVLMLAIKLIVVFDFLR